MAVKTAIDKGEREKVKSRRKSPMWLRWLKRSISVFVLLLLAGFAAGGVVFMVALKNAADEVNALPAKLDTIALGPSVMYARDGKTKLWEATEERREPIKRYEDIPPLIINATLAAEDKRFFEHAGVDEISAIRSIVTNVREQRSAQGGSTITMQLAKRLFTNPEKSYMRKLRDVAIAMQIEKQLTKKEILRNYLNQIYYGQGAYGIRAAAEVYFGKRDLKKVTVGEAALLSRLVRRPSDENPYANPEVAYHNRDVVLGVMRKEGMISEDQYYEAKAEKPKLMPKQFGSGEQIYRFPHFVRYTLDKLKKDLPNIDFARGGYTIETTIDPDLQRISEKEVRALVKRYKSRRVTTAAFVLLRSDGQILSMVGGIDFEKNQYNVIAQGKRQPGSAFKPFVYAAALSTGALRPGDRVSNAPYHWRDPASGKTWSPKNSGGGSGGSFSISAAIANSKNIPAVWVTDKVTPYTAANYCRDVFGFRSEIKPVLSIALGVNEVSPLEMAEAYSIFQLHGSRATPFGIVRVIAPDKSIVKVYRPDIRENMLDNNVATLMDEYLEGVVKSGTARKARSVDNARGKTGTTQENKDAWYCGYTNTYIGIGWVANEKYDPKRNPPWRYEPMPGVFGGQVPVEMWTAILEAAQKLRGEGKERKGTRLERDVYVETEVAKSARNSPPPKREETEPDDDGDEVAVKPPKEETKPPVERVIDPPIIKPPVRRNSDGDPGAESEGEQVPVEVCADTGLKATIYCPETVTRRYKKSSAPKRWCRRHSP